MDACIDQYKRVGMLKNAVLDYYWMLFAIRRLLPHYLRRRPPPSRHAFITLHSLALRRPPTALVPCRRLPPPSRCVVPRPHLSHLRRRSEGTAASPHPSPSRRRRGKIPPIVVVLRSNNDASSRPPPPSSRVVHRPPPTRSPSPPSSSPPVAATSSSPPHFERPSLQRTPTQRFC